MIQSCYYAPNPAMLLRAGDAWVPVFDVLALDWVDRGCGRDNRFDWRPKALIQRLAAAPSNPAQAAQEPETD